MDMAIQEIATQAIESPSADNPLFWIGVGVVLAIQVADKAIIWIRTLRGKGTGYGTVNDKLGNEILSELRKITDIMDKDFTERVRQQEQVDDLFKWHSPDNEGEQKWKGATIHRIVERTEGVIKSLINDMNMSFKDVTGILTDHIKDDAEQQHTMNNKLSAIERYTKR